MNNKTTKYLAMINIQNRFKLSDFKYLFFENDFIYLEDLKRKGIQEILINDSPFNNLKEFKKEKWFSYKFDSLEVGLILLKNILKIFEKNNRELYDELTSEEGKFIFGFNFFKTDIFNEFKFQEEIFEKIKDEWKHFGKRCNWNYVCLVKYGKNIFFIENSIETRIEYPLNTLNKNIHQAIVMPNKQRHFVHLNELTEEEIILNTPKQECFRKIENYLFNHFYNCPNVNISKII